MSMAIRQCFQVMGSCDAFRYDTPFCRWTLFHHLWQRGHRATQEQRRGFFFPETTSVLTMVFPIHSSRLSFLLFSRCSCCFRTRKRPRPCLWICFFSSPPVLSTHSFNAGWVYRKVNKQQKTGGQDWTSGVRTAAWTWHGMARKGGLLLPTWGSA